MCYFAWKVNELMGMVERLAGDGVVLAARCERQQRRIDILEDVIDKYRTGEIPSVVVINETERNRNTSRPRKVVFADPSGGL